jgi:hypothetical protein
MVNKLSCSSDLVKIPATNAQIHGELLMRSSIIRNDTKCGKIMKATPEITPWIKA